MIDEPPDEASSPEVEGPPEPVPVLQRQRGPSTGADKVRTVLRGTGQALITAGLVILLFVVYEVWVTNIFAHYKQQKVEHDLVQAWADNQDPTVPLPGGGQQTIPDGVGIANLYIPRLGSDYHFAIVEGTGDSSLEKGPGHYTGTALPGQTGDFAVAGHRVGKGEPFLNLDQLQPGDAVVVETKTDWYVYRVFGDAATNDLSKSLATPPAGATVTAPSPVQALAAGVVGRQIVKPSDGSVILPVPDDPEISQAQATGQLMTLTTCEPKFTATSRMIVHAYLARTVARIPPVGSAKELLPKELDGGTL
jgi:sortase A